MQVRRVKQILTGTPAEDGAGVKLSRVLGTARLDYLDPFLLLDEFKSEDAGDYIAGFPSHPHRGFETVTYLKHGRFRHKDSKGNEGLLTPGSVQWMTAGRGIIHSEMPEMSDGLLWGYQLWLNLPSRLKMTEPRYQDIPPERIPEVELAGASVKIIAGEFAQARGPAQAWYPVNYFDVALAPGSSFAHPVPPEMNSFCYLYEGNARFGPAAQSDKVGEGRLIVFDDGETVRGETEKEKAGFLFLAANRIDEPIARAGPFVMNTREELYQAFQDYKAGTLA